MLQDRIAPPSKCLPSFGIYIHWPFCESKCPYCDFNSHVRESIDHSIWQQAYLKEIDYYATLTGEKTVTSIFFGGGTPSLMLPENTRAIIDQIQKSWHIANDCEITLEANPGSVEREKFRNFRQAGINRVSIGIQALDDESLKFLGRRHNAAEGIKALETAHETFDRFTFDLIYARPDQTLPQWKAELDTALRLAGGHLSLYQLTIEQGTPFFIRHKRGEFEIPNDDLAGAMYEETQEILELAGLPAYEVSNHAAPEQESRHNLTYWRYDDYAGIGPGAHGRLSLDEKKIATCGHRAPEIWLERVLENGHGAHPFEEISREKRLTESLMMGLRLREGIDLSTLSKEAGAPWDSKIDQKRLQNLLKEKMLFLENGRLKPSPAGLQRLNAVLAYLLSE